MPFIIESWFWRGTQSAIFYYLSCAPCVGYNYRRKRRKDALQAERSRAEVVKTQPGAIAQPGPFETNEAWAEELVAGPGPPKGWKHDKLLEKVKRKPPYETFRLTRKEDTAQPLSAPVPDQVAIETQPLPRPNLEGISREGEEKDDGDMNNLPVATRPQNSDIQTPPRSNDALAEDLSSVQDPNVEPPLSSSEPMTGPNVTTRPGADRRISSTLDVLRDTLRSSIHPDTWNWKRYDREDEVFWGVNERINRLWDRATGQSAGGRSHPGSRAPSQSRGRKRAETNDSDRYDYHRARHPEVNELHPPVVSQLPSRKEEVGWMLQPPPSRAVMEGKLRPSDEKMMRWPLAKIATTKEETTARLEREEASRRAKNESDKLQATPSRQLPPLITSSPEAESDYGSRLGSWNFDEENARIDRPASLPLAYEGIVKPLTPAHLVDQKRNSWHDGSSSAPVINGDGGLVSSNQWRYSSIWVA